MTIRPSFKPVYYSDHFVEEFISQENVLSIDGISYKQVGKESFVADEPIEHVLQSFNSGDQAAFTAIHNELYPNIYYFARRFLSSDDAADMTADVFLKLWKIEKRFNSLKSIKVWLQITVRNASINHLQHDKYKRERLKEFVYLFSEEDERYITEEETKAELIKRIVAEIEKLPTQPRKILKMAWLGNLKNKEIAHQLGLSPNTIRNHKQKALSLLRLKITLPIVLIFLLPLIKFTTH